MIEFINVGKRYKNQQILSNISFKIEKGEIVVLIGLSGCGKTTTLKMMNKLVKPTTGEIKINNELMSKIDVIKLRRKMGYVIQQTGLFPHMTIKENIELISKVEKIDKTEMAQRTNEVMQMVGLDPDEYATRYPNELSGGQQQRVGVARAFATNPEIILMDEPFSALDPITREDLQNELLHLQEQMNKTIVFVTHDMQEAIKIADKICIMNKGEIIQYDTPENILKYPKNEFIAQFVGKNRIWGSPEYIKVEDIMIENPITCFPQTQLLQCMEKMRFHKVDSLLVVEEKTKKYLGVITAKQIQREQKLLQKASAFMKEIQVLSHPQDSLVDLLKKIGEREISIIPVLEEREKLVGLITKASLVTTLSQQYIDAEEIA